MRHPNTPPFAKWICPHTRKPYALTWTFLIPYDSCEQCRPEKLPHLVRRMIHPPDVAAIPLAPGPRLT